MVWEIRFTPGAERNLGGLPREIQLRFNTKWPALQEDPLRARPGLHVEPLAGIPNGYKLRVGEYRGLYQVIGPCVLFTRFGHRSTVYR